MKKVKLTEGGLKYLKEKGHTDKWIEETLNDPEEQFTIRWANAMAEGKYIRNDLSLVTDPKTGRHFMIEHGCYSNETTEEAINREIQEGCDKFYMFEVVWTDDKGYQPIKSESDSYYEGYLYETREEAYIREAAENDDILNALINQGGMKMNKELNVMDKVRVTSGINRGMTGFLLPIRPPGICDEYYVLEENSDSIMTVDSHQIEVIDPVCDIVEGEEIMEEV